MPVPPTPDDLRRRALLILLLLARDADLSPDQIVSRDSRALVAGGLGAALRHRAPRRRPWTCPHRWAA